MADEINWPQDAAPLTTQQVLDSTPVMAANTQDLDRMSYVTVGQLANKTKEIVEITGELIDPIAPGTQASPAVIPAGPAGQKRKFTPAPGFYSFGGQTREVTSDKQWYFYWNGSAWQLVDLGLLPDGTLQIINNNNTILSTGRFWNTNAGVGGTMPESPAIFGNGTTLEFNATRVRMYKGDVVSLRTRGGANSRGYYVTDLNRVVKVIAPSNVNTMSTPFSYEYTEDGWLYITCIQAGYSAFSLTIKRYILAEVDSRVKILEDKMDGEAPSVIFNPAKFRNNPFPTTGDILRILFIANSYAIDITRDIMRFINAEGIDPSKVAIYVAFQSGGSLNDWWTNFQNNTSFNLEHRGGTYSMGNTNAPINTLIAKDWDFIVLQQASASSTNYATYSNLPKIINHIKQRCTNQKVCFAWNSIWSYADGYSITPTGLDRLKLTLESTKKVLHEIGIDIIIPTGVAIQNARLVTDPVVDGGNQLTRDGTHLAFGTGTYIGAATLFYTLFSPFFNVKMVGSSARRPAEAGAGDNAFAYPVDETNFEVCQKAAFLAVMDRWNVNNPTLL